MAKVSVIIPVFEPLYLIDMCLKSILIHTNNIENIQEIIIVDNSESGAWPTIGKYNSLLSTKNIRMFYCRTFTNLYHVKSVREGLKFASADFILLYNDDICVPKNQPEWLNRLLKAFDDYENCGVSTLVLLHSDHTIYWIGEKGNKHIDHFMPYNFEPQDDYLNSNWSNLACGLTKHEFLKLFPFDGINPATQKKHAHYSGDRFFGMRLKTFGKIHVVCRDVWIYHYNERVRLMKQDYQRAIGKIDRRTL